MRSASRVFRFTECLVANQVSATSDLSYRHTGSAHLLSLARLTHDRILTTTRLKTWVTPVMVLWADFPQRVHEERCAYVHGDELLTWLRSRPQVIAPSRVTQVASAVRASWTPS